MKSLDMGNVTWLLSFHLSVGPTCRRDKKAFVSWEKCSVTYTVLTEWRNNASDSHLSVLEVEAKKKEKKEHRVAETTFARDIGKKHV